MMDEKSFMRQFSNNVVFICGMLFFVEIALAAPDATQMLTRCEEHTRGNTLQAELKLTIQKPDWSRSMTMKVWQKGLDFSLILISDPARDKGTSFLKIKSEVWNWLPKVERIVKIPPSMMMQSWMGSDFTNDDLVKESSIVRDYTHKVISEGTQDGESCWQLELLPKPESAVVWGKLVCWLEKEDPYLMRRMEYYDEDGGRVNVLTFSDVKELGGRRLPTRLEMTPQEKNGQKTVLQYHAMKFDETLDDSFFSEQNLKKVR